MDPNQPGGSTEPGGTPTGSEPGAPAASPAADRSAPPDLPPAPPWAPAPPPPPPPSSFGRGAGPAAGLEYATFGGRLIAYVIDLVILGVVTGILAAISGAGLLGIYGLGAFGGFGGFGGFGPFAPGRALFDIGFGGIAFALLGAVLSGIYFVYFWTRNGATPGQSFLALEVRNAADGARLSQDQAIRRWAFLTVPFVSVFPLVGLLVFVYQIYLAYTTYEDPAHQGFHDREARTVVVRRVT